MDYNALRRALLEEDGGEFIVSGPLAKAASDSECGEDANDVARAELAAMDPAERKRRLADMSARNHRLALAREAMEQAAKIKKTAELDKDAGLKELKSMLGKYMSQAKKLDQRVVKRMALEKRMRPRFA